MKQPALSIIAGPTASGKTSLAIRLAQKLGAEIVSADSQQLYRHFDIGTAKPDAAELAAVPHHLISVLDPLARCSASQFMHLADDAIAQIHSRNRPVVVVGGTGLYLRVLLHGVVDAPGSDETVRSELTAIAETQGNAALHEILKSVDPVTAQKLPVADRVRIIRALEIHRLTGQTASAHREQHQFAPLRYRARLWVLTPPREALYETINRRTEKMFAAGLVDEARELIAKGYRHAAPMEAVGYAQALDVIEGRLTEAEAIADCAQKTRHYAKRQLTWFRKEAGARELVPSADVELLAREHQLLSAAD